MPTDRDLLRLAALVDDLADTAYEEARVRTKEHREILDELDFIKAQLERLQKKSESFENKDEQNEQILIKVSSKDSLKKLLPWAVSSSTVLYYLVEKFLLK
jgi:molecular chaperone GrpE (heat shock protein)